MIQREAMREAGEAQREAMAAAIEARRAEFASAAGMRKEAFAKALQASRGARAEARAALISARETIGKASGISDEDRRTTLSKIDSALSRLERQHMPTLQ